MSKRTLIDEIEGVFVSELGSGSSYILNRNLTELGLTRKTFRKKDIDQLLVNVLKDYHKLLGGHVNILRKEVKDISENQN